MKFNRIASLLLSCTMILTSMTSCRNKDVKKSSESESHISETETSQTENSITTEPVTTTASAPETFPDFPISYPEIEKKDTGDLYEAESALLSEGLVIEGLENTDEISEPSYENNAPFSGEGYVTGFKPDGSTGVIFNVNAPSNQHYDLSFSIASEHRVNCRISLNGNEISTFKTMNDGEF
ncbi:MAG: hypothetical protein K2G83_07815, partial [Ruminococcus sp.]|nr:hypothetical protein [Ruminococcus sp.]